LHVEKIKLFKRRERGEVEVRRNRNRTLFACMIVVAIVTVAVLLFIKVGDGKDWNKQEGLSEWTPANIEAAFKRGALDVDRLHKHFELNSDVFKRAEEPYTVKRFDAGTSAEILSISSHRGEFWQYLVFTQDQDQVFLGHIDFRNTQNGVQPSMEIVEHDQKKGTHWIILKAISGSGAGFSRQEVTWYEIGDNKIRPVLNYPIEEIRTTIDIDKVANTPPFFSHIKSQVRNAHTVDGVYLVDLEFSVQYTNGFDKLPEVKEIFRLEPVIRYVYDEENARFKIDTSNSDRNNWHFAIWPDEMLRQHYAELEDIARGSDESLKEWLKLMLNHLVASPQKQTLLDLIEKQEA